MSIWRAKNDDIDKWNIIMELAKGWRKMAIYDNKEGFVMMISMDWIVKKEIKETIKDMEMIWEYLILVVLKEWLDL